MLNAPWIQFILIIIVLCFKLVFVAVTAGRRLLSRRRLRPPRFWRHRRLVAAAPARECGSLAFFLTLAQVLCLILVFSVLFFQGVRVGVRLGMGGSRYADGTTDGGGLTSNTLFRLDLYIDFVVDFFCS
jgi:hypothetical protein